jgi:hypothetical protein
LKTLRLSWSLARGSLVKKPLSEQTTEGLKRLGATPTRAVADREQDFDA